MRVSILGGSSPFILDLFITLAALPERVAEHITLFGRDERALALVARFAAHRLPGTKIACTTEPDEACRGFDVIIHQIRYGALAGRSEDERAAAAHGAIPDETLGPSALSCALRMRDPLLETARRIAEGSPHAHVINLTNPLGVSTSLMREAGIANPIGICELPALTAATAARLAGVEAEALDWQYSGLNHRGFLHGLSAGREELLPRVMAAGEDKAFGGLTPAQVGKYGALPTKYFQLVSRGEAISPPGRAAVLEQLRETILSELEEAPDRDPPSLALRSQPWWDLSVVPLLAALKRDQPVRQLLNLVDDEGITREGWCEVSTRGASWIGSPPPPPRAARWVRRFEAHERAVLAAVAAPTPANIDQAMRLDPVMRSAQRD